MFLKFSSLLLLISFFILSNDFIETLIIDVLFNFLFFMVLLVKLKFNLVEFIDCSTLFLFFNLFFVILILLFIFSSSFFSSSFSSSKIFSRSLELFLFLFNKFDLISIFLSLFCIKFVVIISCSLLFKKLLSFSILLLISLLLSILILLLFISLCVCDIIIISLSFFLLLLFFISLLFWIFDSSMKLGASIKFISSLLLNRFDI